MTEFLGPQPIRQLVYQYTPSGNLAQRQSTVVQPPAEPLSERFRYDCDGRLVEYQNLLTGQLQASRYDGLGNKVLIAGTAGNKAMVYDGPNVLAEYNMAVPSTPALTATYLFGQEIDEGLARIDAATGNPAFYLKDALGSTRQIVDQVSALQATITSTRRSATLSASSLTCQTTSSSRAASSTRSASCTTTAPVSMTRAMAASCRPIRSTRV